MWPFWHPLSTVLLFEPRVLATPRVLQMLLGAEGEVALFYAGDGMWPAVRHGQRLVAEPVGGEPLRRGESVIACPAGVPDVLRVTGPSDPALVRVVADADPREAATLERSLVLARLRLPVRSTTPRVRELRRLLLDLGEATHRLPDAASDPADTVQAKYEMQAPFYARREGVEIEPALLERLDRHVRPGGRMLVLGSGSGKECFALAGHGWDVVGIDFAPSMVAAARAEAARRGLAIRFHEADLRSHVEAARSIDCVLFTYDVYSFLPERSDRIRLLERVRGWLSPAGVAFLSARRVQSVYDRSILMLQHLARGRSSGRSLGASHTRWISSNGTLHRSFVHVFAERRLVREIETAGFRVEDWKGGHGMLRPLTAHTAGERP